MFNKLKGNGKLVEKLIINQVGITIFGIVLYIAACAVYQSNEVMGASLKIGTSVFSVLFYLVLLFSVVKEDGLKDRIRIESGKMKYDPFKFLHISLAANALNILLGIIIAAAWILNTITGHTSEFGGNLTYISAQIVRFTEGMYFGLWKDALSQAYWFPLAMVVPSIIVCTFGYMLAAGGKTEPSDKKN